MSEAIWSTCHSHRNAIDRNGLILDRRGGSFFTLTSRGAKRGCEEHGGRGRSEVRGAIKKALPNEAQIMPFCYCLYSLVLGDMAIAAFRHVFVSKNYPQ